MFQKIITRFPPEPNGFLHIGHAKSICLNFGIAQDYQGTCNLRFDDTNPAKEEQHYVDAIKDGISWLGYAWDKECYASDYFDQLYAWAVRLINEGHAYVDSQTPEEIAAQKGTPTSPGSASPYRNQDPKEALRLFEEMKAGKHQEGSYVLRFKGDMASSNMLLRDPILYRIMHKPHHRTKEAWCIYPMYDYAHPLEDALEGITHSLCSLEFQDNRELYDWVIENTAVTTRPRQYEFARLNLSYTVLSKRRLTELVQDQHVSGWDDPRMPTLAGLRRRGLPAAALRDFASRIGVTKSDSVVEMALLEHCVRDHLNKSALRRMAVLDPLKVVIENYPEEESEELEAVNNPESDADGTRMVPFGRELWIERADFMEDPPKKFFRLAPGREVRLRYAYYLTCTEVIKDSSGNVTELRCNYDPATKGGGSPDGRKVKATLHWVSAAHAVAAEVRLYENLFTAETPGAASGDMLDDINQDSLGILNNCQLEPALGETGTGDTVQFERQGYFAADPDSTPDRPVFNRTIGLRDTWAKVQKKEG